MTRHDEERPTYAVLQAIRDGQRIDMFYGETNNLAAGRKHARTASRKTQAALRGLRKLKGRI